MKLVTPPMQQSGCPSQNSTVPKLLSAHSDGIVDSTQLLNVSVSYSPYGNIWYLVKSTSGEVGRFNYPATI